MLHYAEDRSLRAVPAEALCAPFALAAREIDLAHDAFADEFRCSASMTSPTNSWPGHPREAVVAALEFEVGIADSAVDQPNGSEAGGAPRPGYFPNLDRAIRQMDCDHAAVNVCGFQLQTRSSQRLVFVSREGPAVRKPNTESSKNGLRVRTAL